VRLPLIERLGESGEASVPALADELGVSPTKLSSTGAACSANRKPDSNRGLGAAAQSPGRQLAKPLETASAHPPHRPSRSSELHQL
jgi:hypothetical protein